METNIATMGLLSVGLALAATGCGKTAEPRGKQGAWLDVRYDSDGVVRTDRILVEKTTYVPADGAPTAVAVRWRVENQSKRPASFGWKNKFLVDVEGRQFSPKSGHESPELQPTEKSETLVSMYELPAGVLATKLSWGLVQEGKLLYRVELAPKEFGRCDALGEVLDLSGKDADAIAERCRVHAPSEETISCFLAEGKGAANADNLMALSGLARCMRMAREKNELDKLFGTDEATAGDAGPS